MSFKASLFLSILISILVCSCIYPGISKTDSTGIKTSTRVVEKCKYRNGLDKEGREKCKAYVYDSCGTLLEKYKYKRVCLHCFGSSDVYSKHWYYNSKGHLIKIIVVKQTETGDKDVIMLYNGHGKRIKTRSVMDSISTTKNSGWEN